MTRIRVELAIAAPPQICFDLARSVEAHLRSARETRETVVGGVTSGLLGLHDEVTWRARHLGMWHELTSRITRFEPPRYFRDEMVRGPFKRFEHDHFFDAVAEGTLMRDIVDFEAPWGLVGRLTEKLVLERHLRSFLERRAWELRRAAESSVARASAATHPSKWAK